MSQVLIVLAVAMFTYVFFGSVIKLASSTIKVRGFEIPAMLALGVASIIGISVWMLFDAFGIKPAAVGGAIVIEAIAFWSLCSRGTQSDGASIWLLKAFALGGLFVLCIALLA